jgi:hypothetical protein
VPGGHSVPMGAWGDYVSVRLSGLGGVPPAVAAHARSTAVTVFRPDTPPPIVAVTVDGQVSFTWRRPLMEAGMYVGTGVADVWARNLITGDEWASALELHLGCCVPRLLDALTAVRPRRTRPLVAVALTRNVISGGYSPVMDDLELFGDLVPPRRRPAHYRAEVTLGVTAGPDDMEAADFLESLEGVGVQLDVAGTAVLFMATTVVIGVVVQAGSPVAAMVAAADAVARAVEGRRLEVRSSRVTGLLTEVPVVVGEWETAAVTAGLESPNRGFSY